MLPQNLFFPKMMKHDVFSLPKILSSQLKSDRKAIKGVFTMGAPGNVFSCFPFYVKREKGILTLNLALLFRLFGGIPARRRWEGTSALLPCRQTKKDWHGCLDPLQKKSVFFFLPPNQVKVNNILVLNYADRRDNLGFFLVMVLFPRPSKVGVGTNATTNAKIINFPRFPF